MRAGHGGHEGLVVQRAMARPVSGKGSARMAQSISPVRSISSSLTVKFSCSISGICGRARNGVAHQVGQQVGADGVDHAQRQARPAGPCRAWRFP